MRSRLNHYVNIVIGYTYLSSQKIWSPIVRSIVHANHQKCVCDKPSVMVTFKENVPLSFSECSGCFDIGIKCVLQHVTKLLTFNIIGSFLIHMSASQAFLAQVG